MSVHRFKTNRCQGIKDYYEGLRTSIGLKTYEIAERVGVDKVTMCYSSYRLDHMKIVHLSRLAKVFGLTLCELVTKLQELRNDDLES